MGLREVIADPRFQAADPEKQSAVLKRLGASDEFVNKFIEAGVDKKPDLFYGGRGPDNELMTPELAQHQAMTGLGLAGGIAAGELAPPALAGLGVAARAVPALTGAIVGAAPKLMRGDLGGALEHGAYGAMGMYGFGKLAKLYRVLKSLGLAGEEAAAAGAGGTWNLTPSEAARVMRGAATATEGTLGPTVEEVATKMVPAGQLAPLTRAEMAAAVRGAAGAETPVSQVASKMVTNATPQLSQADAAAVVRGATRTPISSGYVENPSVATVAEQMVPAGGQGKLIHDLTRAGFSTEQATAIAANMTKNGAQAVVAPAVEAAAAPAVAAETAAPVAAAEAAPVARLSREEASRQLQELLARKVAEGKAEAAAKLEEFMASMGHGSKVVIPAALLKAQERNRRAHKALQSQGAGVTEP